MLIGLSSNSTRSYADMKDTRSVVKALYIYTFATLVEWPKPMRSGNFVIGVFGDRTAVYDELNRKYSGKSIGSQEIVIENYYKKDQIENPHILYVDQENSQYISSLSTILAPKSTLLVTEKTGALSKGSIVNFVVDGNTQKYEINKKNAKKHKLAIAERLSGLATKVIE